MENGLSILKIVISVVIRVCLRCANLWLNFYQKLEKRIYLFLLQFFKAKLPTDFENWRLLLLCVSFFITGSCYIDVVVFLPQVVLKRSAAYTATILRSTKSILLKQHMVSAPSKHDWKHVLSLKAIKTWPHPTHPTPPPQKKHCSEI